MRFLGTAVWITCLSFIHSLCLSQNSYPAPPTQGLVGWWKGNGDSSDSSGNGFNGVLQGGMGFGPGIVGQAFVGGTGKKVLIPDNPAFELSSLSVAAWVNPGAFGYVILFRGDDRPGLDPYSVGLNGQSQFGLTIDDASNTTFSLYSPNPLPYQVWTHVAVTFDSSTGTMKLYTNGVLTAQATTTIRPFLTLDPSSEPALDIGNIQGGDFPFIGAIADVLLYSRALSPAEVAQLPQLNCNPHPATATATVVNGFVVSVAVTDGGCGYTNTPSVVIEGGGGTGATAAAVVSNGVVSSITITSAGNGYANTPLVKISSPAGSLSCNPHAATATATVVNGFVVGANVIDGGCGYTNTPSVTIEGGGGTGATASAVVSNGIVSSITITSAGTGYTNAPLVYIYSPFGFQVGIEKFVRPYFTDVFVGTNYQLQASTDLLTWTNSGDVFIATNRVMSFPAYFDAGFYNLFFRLQVAP